VSGGHDDDSHEMKSYSSNTPGEPRTAPSTTSGRSNKGTTNIRASIVTKIVLLSPLFTGRVACDRKRIASFRLSEWRQKILRNRLKNVVRCETEGSSANRSVGVWKYAPSTTRVMGTEQLPAWVMAPRTGRRYPSKRCRKGWLRATTMDITDAQRGGIIKPVVLVQILPPVRTTRCGNVGRWDHWQAGTETTSCSEFMSGLEMGMVSESEGWGTVDTWRL